MEGEILMEIERYIIELENGSFAKFEQGNKGKIWVHDYKDFLMATNFYKEDAEEVFNEFVGGDDYWNFVSYYRPKTIRKITVTLE